MPDLSTLIAFLEEKGFQEPETGKLFHPTYIYTYDASEEYQLRMELDKLLKRLKRPNHFLDCMIINLFELFIMFLKNSSFGGKTILEQILKKEDESIEDSRQWINDEINSEAFYALVEEKITGYFGEPDQQKRVYLIVHGVGDIYPYLRASEFLKRMEHVVKNFKLILFYPGKYESSQYCLFGELKNDNIYRANLLNQLINPS
jgi:hypothetical protein